MPRRVTPYRRKFIPAERPKGYNPNFTKYDAMVARWDAQNPNPTIDQRRDAVRAIAHVCGI